MTTEPKSQAEMAPEPRITVDYKPGRWGKVFHMFDLDGREICLNHKEAVRLARGILKIAKEQESAPKSSITKRSTT
ncbi:MAG: hypothetical protein V1932_08725 [Chloroflexota bacterium]